MATDSVEICNNALTLIGSRRITALSDPSKEGRICNDNYNICRLAVLRMHPWNFATDRTELAGVTISNVTDGGVSGIKITTATAHGFSTNDYVTVDQVVGTVEANVTATVNVDDTTNFYLTGTTFENDYVSGGVCAFAPSFQFKYKFPLPSDFVRIHTVADSSDNVLSDKEYVLELGHILTDYYPVRLRYVKNLTTTTEFDTLFDEALAIYLAEKICFKLSGSETQKVALQRQLKEVMQKARFVDSVEEPSHQLDSDEWLRSRWDTNQGYVRDPMT